ncbi:hypothetical protein [Marinactinospora rubrisoli]|uniref:Lipoprotein n=1 Tax=Marinactinospora rubrisoli TaxID=2715399 RepID=A0ABW2KE61_9ACTN
MSDDGLKKKAVRIGAAVAGVAILGWALSGCSTGRNCGDYDREYDSQGRLQYVYDANDGDYDLADGEFVPDPVRGQYDRVDGRYVHTGGRPGSGAYRLVSGDFEYVGCRNVGSSRGGSGGYYGGSGNRGGSSGYYGGGSSGNDREGGSSFRGGGTGFGK